MIILGVGENSNHKHMSKLTSQTKKSAVK